MATVIRIVTVLTGDIPLTKARSLLMLMLTMLTVLPSVNACSIMQC